MRIGDVSGRQERNGYKLIRSQFKTQGGVVEQLQESDMVVSFTSASGKKEESVLMNYIQKP